MAKVQKKPAPTSAPAAATAEAPAKRGPGRPKSGESDLPDDIGELIALLETTEDQAQKRRIRARLRARGHRGGLGKRGAKKDEAEATPAAKPGKQAKAVKKPRPAATEEEVEE